MATLSYVVDGKRHHVEVSPGTGLLEAMQREGIDVSFPCNGTQRCGKCRVHAHGEMSIMGDIERRMLGERSAEDLRLACFTKILGDVTIELPQIRQEDRIALRFDRMMKFLRPLYEGEYGFAVDIGTTTIVAYLFCKDSLWALAYDGSMNQQQRYGADVLSRIDYANKNGVSALRDTVRTQLSGLFLTLCEEAGVDPDKLDVAVITGNTVMLHLLDGLDAKSLAMAPFNVVSHFGHYADFTIKNFEHMRIYLPRCISAYLGADVTCSVLAADLVNLPDNTLLVDIGTNGEIVLKAEGKLICCSTAAGPAFEGAGISSGMSAKQGAISKVWIEDDRMLYSVIHDSEAVGVCGSGLIDAISVARSLGIINVNGKIVSGEKSFAIGDSGVYITQGDVRELQMAKAAIRAGIDTLLDMKEVDPSAVEELILCGGFGSFLDPITAAGIGMIPSELRHKTRAIGNGAGAGASMILQDRFNEEESMRIATEAEVVELSLHKSFSTRYVKAMYFPKDHEMLALVEDHIY